MGGGRIWLKICVCMALLVSLLTACNARRSPDTDKIGERPQQSTLALTDDPPEEIIVGVATQADLGASEPLSDRDDRAPFGLGLIPEARWALDELAGASVYHIDLIISDDRLQLEGHEVILYTNQEQTTLEQVYFQLFPNATGGTSEILNVSVDGISVEAEYQTYNLSAMVELPQPLEPGQSAEIELDFVVNIPLDTAGTYGTFGYFDDILMLDEFYPVIPVYDLDGWHYQIPTNGDLTYLDASFYRVQVTAPKELVIVASGIETERQTTGNQQTVTFLAGPARDFYLAASNHFFQVSRDVGETRINSYALPDYAEGAEYALDIAERASQVFNQRFGAYPYVEMDLVSIPMSALGIEYPGIMGVTLGVYDLNAELRGTPNRIMLESTVAHEVGHQWFYNTVGNDQVGEAWLDEAVVQYITALYYLDQYGTEGYNGFRQSWNSRWDRVEGAEIPIGMPSEYYSPTEYSAIIYGRGPLFIEALADEMGEEVFDEFIRDYYQVHQWKIGSGVSFKELAQEHCECDLTHLFDEWVW